MKLTKQGVRNLDSKPPKHEHKFSPRTFTTRNGGMVTAMQCHCGERPVETPEEKQERLLDEADVENLRLEGEAYGWGES